MVEVCATDVLITFLSAGNGWEGGAAPVLLETLRRWKGSRRVGSWILLLEVGSGEGSWMDRMFDRYETGSGLGNFTLGP